MMDREKRECLICKHCTERKVLGKMEMATDNRNPLPNKYDVVTCTECGFCFADTSATMQEYEQYYESCNEYSTSPKDFQKKDRLFKAMIDECHEYLSFDSPILDIGIGRGALLEELNNRGYHKLYGIDPSTESIKRVEQIAGGTMIKGSVYDPYPKLNNKMHFIFMVDVIEHLLRADTAVKQVRNWLEKRGYIFVALPDYGNMFRDNTPLANNFNCEHINYFSEHSLDNLFIQYGFSKVCFKRVPVQSVGNSIIGTMWGIYQKDGDIPKYKQYDYVTEYSILDYLKREEKRKRDINDKIDKITKTNVPAIVWGAGNYAKQLLNNTSLNYCDIRAFIDNNSQKIGSKINGIEVKGTDTLREILDENMCIIICSMLSANDIYLQIRNMDINNEIVIL